MTKDKVQKIFSQNLKTLLDMKNATQLELAKYLGVSNTTINNYVKGYIILRKSNNNKYYINWYFSTFLIFILV